MTATDAELSQFVRDALSAGSSRDDIATALRDAGWPEDQVRLALARFAEVTFPVPVPRPRAYLSARDACLYLIMFSMLGLSAYYLGSLIFQFIDLGWLDPALDETRRRFHDDRIRYAIAVLIVAFPLFLLLSVKTGREIGRDSTKRGSGVRKWLTYMTLLVASFVIVGDLIGLIYQYLNGSLTMRIALKLLTVGVIASAIFLYYLRSAARDMAEP